MTLLSLFCKGKQEMMLNYKGSLLLLWTSSSHC